MNGVKLNVKTLELDKRFSTTRRVVKGNQDIDFFRRTDEKNPLLLPEKLDRVGEGGMRTKSYLKEGASNKPLISVITVAYNGSDHLEQAIRSVIEQTYDNVEYIIIDGGSTDGTLEILKKYDGVLDYWVSESDEGVYDAMNKGLQLFRGDYVLFLGCDDSLFDVFHEVVTLFTNKNTSYYGNVVLSKNSQIYDGKFYSFKLFYKNIPHQAIFYSKFVFDECGFNLNYPVLADYALNLNLFSNKKHNLKYISKTIANYNNEDGISSVLTDHAFYLDRSELIKRYYSIFHYMAYILMKRVYASIKFVLKRK